MGKVIDLSKKLRLGQLAADLMKDLGLPETTVNENGGAVEIAKRLQGILDTMSYESVETIEEDHPELFKLLREDQ